MPDGLSITTMSLSSWRIVSGSGSATALDNQAGLRAPGVDPDLALANEALHLRSRQLGQSGCQELVQPVTRVLTRHDELFRVAGGLDLTAGGSPGRGHFAAFVASRAPGTLTSGVFARSHQSIARLTGTITTDTNCEVDRPRIIPRSSPR